MFIPSVLTEVLDKPEESFLVLSDIKSIQQFFVYLNIPNVIFKVYGWDKRKDGIFALRKKKKEIIHYLSEYDIKELVFFHTEYGDMANWLIDKLSKKIYVKFCKIYDRVPSVIAPISLRSLKLKLVNYLLWGQNMDICKAPYLFPALPASYYKKIKSETIYLPVRQNVISAYVNKKLQEFDFSGKYILLTGTAVQNNWYEEKEYTDFIDGLITTIGKEKVVSKCHPRYNGLYGIEKELQQVPSFIPGNLLLNCYEIFIGIESTLLVEAALAGKKSISIIDWLKSDKQKVKAQHDFFDNRLGGKGVIFFPKNSEEFIDFINKM
jgi:hypothetical protein